MTQEKGVWLVETETEVHFQFRALKPLRDIQQLTGSFQQLTDPAFYQEMCIRDSTQTGPLPSVKTENGFIK